MPELRDISSEDERARQERERAEDDPRGVDLWIMPYLLDSALWPVLIVLLLHAAAFGAPLLLRGIRDAAIPAILALVMLAYLTFRGFRWETRSRGKFGAISWLIVVTWGLSGIAAFFFDRWDMV